MFSPSTAKRAGRGPTLFNISSRTDREWLGRWIVTRTAAGKSERKCLAKEISASTPPAEVPTARTSRLAMPCSAAAPQQRTIGRPPSSIRSRKPFSRQRNSVDVEERGVWFVDLLWPAAQTKLEAILETLPSTMGTSIFAIIETGIVTLRNHC